MGAYWRIETFECHFAGVLEQKSFAEAEFGDCIGDEDLFRLRVSAKTGSELNRRSKQIVVLLYRFAHCGPNPDLERTLGIRLRMLVQFALDLNCAPNRARCRKE